MFKIVLLCFFLFVLGWVISGVRVNEWLPSAIYGSMVDAAQQSNGERMEELRRIIVQEIGEPLAKNPSQCKLIPFGSKPCGGPVKYLVYSTAKTNEVRLKELVSEFNERQKHYNQERGILSDCILVTEPKVEHVAGVCKIKQDGASMPQ